MSDYGSGYFGADVWRLAAWGCQCGGCERETGRHLARGTDHCSRWGVAVGITMERGMAQGLPVEAVAST